MSLSIVSDGTWEGSKILHKGRDIRDGCTRCDVLMVPGEPVRAILTYEFPELGMSIDEEKPAAQTGIPGHRPLVGS